MRSIVHSAVFLVVVMAAGVFWTAQRSEGTPLYAARTGFACQTCHFDPNGGGPRNDFGFAFARNRHAVTPDTSGQWKDLNVSNRVAENVPVYFGVNQRFMLLSNANVSAHPAERAAFFNMENALYITFQPHPRLTLVYSRDAFNDAVLAQDAFGMISGFPLDGYVKAGRFRSPFGLRMDDHTVSTREGFLNLAGGPSFLPYDPRFPDMGVEVGGDRGSLFGRAAFTNGAANVFGAQPFAQTTAVKLGHITPWYQGAVSFYDDYEKTGAFPFRRADRWSCYALTHVGRVQFLGEVGGGTDQHAAHDPRGARTNVVAAFGEVDYTLNRACNFRLRYDHLETDRDSRLLARPDGSQVSVRDLNSFDRYAIEGEMLPVPFGELRWTYRVIAPVAARDAFGAVVRHERQGYLQFHFSY
jgi:hypothetical protein